jgi:predicted acetyltransferase
MPYLARPNIRYHISYLSALLEYKEEGLDAGPSAFMLQDPLVFTRYTADICAGADISFSKDAAHPPYVMWWWVEGSKYLGRISLRLSLTPYLTSYGGHVGYDVRKSERERGMASAMLAAVLPLARSMGYENLLLVCEKQNAVSRRVIEKNSGMFLDSSYDEEGKEHLRFQINLMPA